MLQVMTLARKRGACSRRTPRTIQEGVVALSLPTGPPASEGRVRHLRYHAEAAGAQSGPLPPALLEGDDVANPCRCRPWCANLVHVGPPVVCRLSALPTLQR